MRTNLFFAFIFCGLFIFGCKKDDDSSKKDNLVLNSFEEMYPNAKDMNWETKDGYQVVEFIKDNKEKEAWFDNKGVWYLTKTEMLFDDLPTAIKDNHKSGKYASWKVEDVDKIERKDREILYVIEVEKVEVEYDLFYSENGKLIKEQTTKENDTYFPAQMSDVVKNYIAEKYPSAKILEIETEKNFVEVDILDKTIHKELLFNLKGEWICTKRECIASEVPSVVVTKLNSLDYAIDQVDEIKYIEEPNKNYYLFEVEFDDVEKDIIVMITPEGVVV